MKWRGLTDNVAESDCGRYQVKLSVDPVRGKYYNAWYVPANKHVDAGHDKAQVLKACERHSTQLELF